MRVETLVLQAGGPAWRLSPWRKTRAELAYRDAAGALHRVEVHQHIPEERWIVPGMRVAAEVDGGRAEVLIDEITPLQERIAACDPPLCDLETIGRELEIVRREIAHAHLERPLLGIEQDVVDAYDDFEDADHAQRLEQRVAARPAQPVVDAEGRLRGTADFVSRTIPPKSNVHQRPAYRGRRLYRVWLYGSGPYPVLDNVHFDAHRRKRDKALLAWGDVPVSVSPSDRNDVRFHWDEYTLTAEEVLDDRIQHEIDVNLGAAKAMAAQHLEMVFAAVDPSQRRQLAVSMRAMGQEVPDRYLHDPERLAKLDALLERGVVAPEEYERIKERI